MKSNVKIYGDFVVKHVVMYPEITFLREITWLKKMTDFERVPNLIDYNEDDYTIDMSYCGEMINKINCPQDWKDQMDFILAGLKGFGCSHNDITPAEILVKDNKLMLVDFGWSTEINEVIPKHWPPALGEIYSLAPHKFDDAYAFEGSVVDIINDVKWYAK